MGALSITHIIVLLGVGCVLFGAGKMPRIATDFAKGIKNFRNEMRDLRSDAPLSSQPGLLSKDN